eukprot:CAMPEP_0171474872 /NCGR_PEP_ID=MMETSP0946-20130122/2683_1 /TAXON_ID=109269 /ORGANISM="Vaucheria litorea, Strain CCMP2940" /LENGTH=415 /DNA_ID=CAMNT_0012004885 /DNA_START=56 /DNA_END=1300 /DNA_ORIENTATION=-
MSYGTILEPINRNSRRSLSSYKHHPKTSSKIYAVIVTVSILAITSYVSLYRGIQELKEEQQIPYLKGHFETSDSEVNLRRKFEAYKAKFNRKYAGKSEETLRFSSFKVNIEKIKKMNQSNPKAVFAANLFFDLTDEDRQKMSISGPYSNYSNIRRNLPNLMLNTAFGINETVDEVGWISENDCAACKMFPDLEQFNLSNMPTALDWREFYSTPVVNQGACGSCWTFSLAGDIEGKVFLSSGNVVELSKQQLVACDQVIGLAEGCTGGFTFEGMQYISKFGGLLPEIAYPYKAVCMNCDEHIQTTPTCDTDLLSIYLESNLVYHIGAWQIVSLGAEYENLLATALVKNGPISIVLNSDLMEFYESGIIQSTDGCDFENLNHAVLLVGMGEEDDIPYWIIKNSWSENWGELGYMRVK